MYLKYTPNEKTAPKCTPVRMIFDSTSYEHWSTIDGLADGSSWEGSCQHMGKWLKDNGYIKSGYHCQWTYAGIRLNYTPTQDWYPISNNPNANDSAKFKCEYQIAHKQSWCSEPSDRITTMKCSGEDYLQCSSKSELKKCSDGSSFAVSKCDCVDAPPGWYDVDGIDFNCGWYAVENRCQQYGDDYARKGTVANKACCVCGGGSHGGSDGKQAEPIGNSIIGDSTSHYLERDTVAALG